MVPLVAGHVCRREAQPRNWRSVRGWLRDGDVEASVCFTGVVSSGTIPLEGLRKRRKGRVIETVRVER